MKKKIWAGAIALTVLASLTLLAACNRQQTVKPQQKGITEAVYASGFIVPKEEYKIYSLADGYITERYLQEGDDVKAGQAIFRIQSDAQGAKADAAGEAYRLAAQNLGENSPVLTDLKLTITNAQIKFTNDSANYARYKNLLAAGAITKADFDKAELSYNMSANDLSAAKQRYTKMRDQLKVEARNASSNLSAAGQDLSNFIIKSLIDGTVFEVYKEPGEAVRRNDAVAMVGDKNARVIELSVDQQDIEKVKIGQEVLIKIDVSGSKVYKAKVTRIYPSMNKNDQSFRVDAEFNEAPEFSLVHTSVEANIIVSKKDKALVIPKSVLIGENEVMIRGLAKGKTVTIKKGIESMDYVEVLEGIKESDDLVIPSKGK